MVLTALLITAMVAMLGLAIDGGRLYVERRVIQTGVDIASLGAADAYFGSINSGGSTSAAMSAAFTAGFNEFAHQVNQATGSGWTMPTVPTACDGSSGTYSSTAGYSMTLKGIPPANSNGAIAGLCVFNATASFNLNAFFISMAGIGSIPAGATASAVTAHLFTPPTMLVLDQDCSASAQDWKAHGTAALTIDGVSWSDGNIVDQSTTVNANGDVFDACDPWSSSSPPGSNFVFGAGSAGFGHAPILPDPYAGWAATSFPGECTTWSCTSTSSTDSTSGTVVELRAGKYSTTTSFGAGCWFLQPGVYNFSSGVTMVTHGMVVSNELTPPDGANTAISGEVTPAIFGWTDSGATCDGGLKAYPGSVLAGSGLLPATTYYFRATSVREEAVAGTNYWRESYLSGATLNNASPSGCVSVQVPALNTTTSVEIGISNVPGMGNIPGGSLLASQYRIYANTTGCSSPMGYVTTASFGSRTPTATSDQEQAGINLGGGSKTALNCPNLPAAAPTPNQFNQNPTNCALGYTATIQMAASNVMCQLASQLLCNVTHPGSTYWPGPLTGTYCDITAPTAGCQPKYLDPGNVLNQNPPAMGVVQDTANENYCVSSTGLCSISPKATAGTVTPGGALLYFPAGTPCIKQTSGAPYVFGALQMASVVFYAQGGATGTCPPNGANINGSQGGQLIGVVYAPAALITVDGGGAPIDGGIVVFRIDVGGNSNTLLTGRFPREQIITPAKLIVCTLPGGSATCPAP